MVAVSSGGKAPVLVRMLRERLEALLPKHLGALAELSGEWRNGTLKVENTSDGWVMFTLTLPVVKLTT
jgi:siroheme synthase-like protein